MEKIFQSYVRNCWYAAGMSSDFPQDKLTGHTICDQPIVMWRTRTGQVGAYDERRAHQRYPHSSGRIMADGTVECAYHGMRHDMAGKCVMIPAHHTGPSSPTATVSPSPVIQEAGGDWIWPGDRSKTE